LPPETAARLAAFLPQVAGLPLEPALATDQCLTLVVAATRRTADRPLCGRRAGRVQSRYVRTEHRSNPVGRRRRQAGPTWLAATAKPGGCARSRRTARHREPPPEPHPAIRADITERRPETARVEVRVDQHAMGAASRRPDLRLQSIWRPRTAVHAESILVAEVTASQARRREERRGARRRCRARRRDRRAADGDRPVAAGMGNAAPGCRRHGRRRPRGGRRTDIVRPRDRAARPAPIRTGRRRRIR
jgi:hypothetical protein